MASQNRSTAPHIVHDLIAHSEQYSFFQAVQLLEDYHHLIAHEEGKQTLRETLIQYSVNPQLTYNKSDIETVRIEHRNEQCIAQVTVNFLGLYGAVSPLPAFYTEAILQANAGDDATRDFMDLFNHRLLSLVYQCWEKYRYYQQYKKFSQGNKGNDQFSNWMYALCGLINPAQRQDPDINWNRLLPFIGTLAMRCHSANLIESVLRYYFEFKHIHIRSNVLRYIEIESDQSNRLGQQCATLSHDLVLGSRVEDRSGKFRIQIKQLSYTLFTQFLPGGEYNVSLKKIIDYILRDQLDYDIELQLQHQEVPRLSLSNKNQEKLGWTTWVGVKQQDNKSVIIPGTIIPGTDK